MNPLIQQIAIGVGGLLVGYVLARTNAGRLLRRTRGAAQQQSNDLESQIAIKRLRIRELEAKVLDPETDEVPIEPLPASFQQILAKTTPP